MSEKVSKKDEEQSYLFGKYFLFKVLLWGLFLLSLISLYLSLRLFIIFCVAIWLLSKYGGAKFGTVMFPQRLINRIKATKSYRIYCVAAMKKQWSAFLMLMNVFPLIWLFISVFYVVNPVLELSEMREYKGTVVRVDEGAYNTGNPDYLWLKTTDGQIIKFINNLGIGDYDYLNNLERNEVVTLWTQKKWGMPPNIRGEHVWQLKHGNHFVTEYSKKRVASLRIFYNTISFVCVLWIFITLRVVKKNTSIT